LINRGNVIGVALAAAAAATMISVRACAGPPSTAATVRVASAPVTLVSAVGQWQPGVNYTLLGRPQPSTAAGGKVEVNEVFWYGCGHCYALDPALESWKASKPAFITFVRIPVIWGAVHEQHAKLFYTLQELGRGDLHSKVFDTIHKQGKMLAAQDPAEARAMQLAFARENGISEKQFNAAYDSPAVAANLDRARLLTGSYEVASVPTMIINGTYSTSVSQAGGTDQLLHLVNDLATSEQRR
jgi:protein dithiol oxidoreductase (disulfide-forming)